MAMLPSGLADRTWVTMERAGLQFAVAGSLSGGSVLSLPGNERPLAATSGRVASAVYDATDHGGVTLIVRDVAAGHVLLQRRFDSAWILPDGVALTSSFIFFAMRPDANTEPTGVFRIDLATGLLETLIEPDVARASILVSANGRTLVSQGVGSEWQPVDVLGLQSGNRHQLAVIGVPDQVSDQQLFCNDGSSFYAFSLGDGRLQWTIPDLRVVRGYLTSDGRQIVAQVGYDIDGFASISLSEASALPRIVVIDSGSGAIRPIRVGSSPLDGRYLWTQVSNDDVAVVISSGHYPEFDLLKGIGFVSTDLINVHSGSTTPNGYAVTIPVAAIAHP